MMGGRKAVNAQNDSANGVALTVLAPSATGFFRYR
jgi:hypothetical protein